MKGMENWNKMKIVYIVQEGSVSSNQNVIGVFYDVKNALQCAFNQINECTSKNLSFKIVEFPINKNIKGGIVVYIVESYHEGLAKVFEIHPIYTFGGIKKWINDQQKAARKS